MSLNKRILEKRVSQLIVEVNWLKHHILAHPELQTEDHEFDL